MELKKSAINEAWKLCSLGGFLGLFLLALVLSNNPQSVDITTVRTTVVAFISSQQQQQPPPPSWSSNRTISPPQSSNSTTKADPPSYNISFKSSNTSRVIDLSSKVKAPSSEKKREYCKMYEGRWVYKPQENPSYHVKHCPFIEEKMSCQWNGRPDSGFQGWSWESSDCRIPLFNGKDMLERLRGKRVIIVGDSLNRNQWESLACLLYTSIPDPLHGALVDADGATYKLFRAKEYNVTLEFYWAPFLVHHDENHKSGKKVLSLDQLQPPSEQWPGADVMLFNSGHWWTHNGKLKSWDVFEYKGEQVEEMKTEVAYERALTTWAHWVARNVDPTKTKVYFRSISPEHKNRQWCFNATRPLREEEPYEQAYPRSMMEVVEGKIREMNGGADGGVHVSYLNITKLSSYRIDGHPSMYRFKEGKEVMKGMSTEMLKQRADCSHWCLPGLPDTWNRIFYASLFFQHLSPGQV